MKTVTITLQLTNEEESLLDDLVLHNRFKNRSECLRHGILLQAVAGLLRKDKFLEVLASREKVPPRSRDTALSKMSKRALERQRDFEREQGNSEG